MAIADFMLVGGIFVLLVILYDDFRSRTIHLFSLLGLTIFCVSYGKMQLSWSEILWNGAFNIGFVVFQLVLVSIWLSLRNRRLIWIVDEFLGLGDILFFIPLCFLFSPFSYIIFYTGSLGIVLAGFLIYRLFNISKNTTIPLAGGMSACLIISFLYCYTFSISPIYLFELF